MERRNVEVGRPEVARYSATISLFVGDYEAGDRDEANRKVSEYIDHLVRLLEADPGKLNWPGVDWKVEEEN